MHVTKSKHNCHTHEQFYNWCKKKKNRNWTKSEKLDQFKQQAYKSDYKQQAQKHTSKSVKILGEREFAINQKVQYRVCL